MLSISFAIGAPNPLVAPITAITSNTGSNFQVDVRQSREIAIPREDFEKILSRVFTARFHIEV